MIGVTTEQAIQHANALRRICAATEIASNSEATAWVTMSSGLASSHETPICPKLCERPTKPFTLRNSVAAIEW
jgi:hypothetical protein